MRYKKREALEQDIAESVKTALGDPELRKLIGRWKLRWGVGIYSKEREGLSLSDNTAFLVQSEDRPGTYIFSVAGTNPVSRYGWEVEDFAVDSQQPWPFAKGLRGRKAATATGTRLAFDHICGMRSHGLTIGEFLRTELKVSGGPEPRELIVTGHSLGGTLTPVLAAWFYEMRREWEIGRRLKIFGYSFAGATPGNPAFAGYVDRLNRSRDFAFYRLWNRYDVVPYAWDSDLLLRIPGLYEPDIHSTRLVRTLTAWALRRTRGLSYRHPSAGAEALPPIHEDGGTEHAEREESWWREVMETFGRGDPDSAGGRIRDVIDTFQFLARVSHEHGMAYFRLLEMEEVLSVFMRQPFFTRRLSKEQKDMVEYLRERIHSSLGRGRKLDEWSERVERKLKEMLGRA